MLDGAVGQSVQRQSFRGSRRLQSLTAATPTQSTLPMEERLRKCAQSPQGMVPETFTVPIANSALLSIKLLRNGTLKTYPGLSHGMATTHADIINRDLLAFVRSETNSRR